MPCDVTLGDHACVLVDEHITHQDAEGSTWSYLRDTLPPPPVVEPREPAPDWYFPTMTLTVFVALVVVFVAYVWQRS
jgi:hypothetical protein